MVNHPDHYNKGNPVYEPYKVIREWGCNFNIGSAIKYLARYNAKWNPIEDLKKAIKYIEFEIDALKNHERDENVDFDELCEKEEVDMDGKPMDEILTDLEPACEDDDDELAGRNLRLDMMRNVLNLSNDDIEKILGTSDRSPSGVGSRVEQRAHRYARGSSEHPNTKFTRANF